MAISFRPLKLDDAELFGVGVEGSVGRSDRTLLRDLADKCLARDKTRLILDFSALATIGGSGAATLADFQRNLIEQGGEAVFAGVAEIVHKFLVQKFDDLPLRCYPSVEDAVADFHARPQSERAAGQSRAAVRPDNAVPSQDTAVATADHSAAAGRGVFVDPAGSDRELDSLLGAFQRDANPAAADTAEPEAAAEGANGQTAEASGNHDPEAECQSPAPPGSAPEVTHKFLSLDEAVAALRAATDGTALRDSLARLLRGYGLADEITYFVFQDGRYVSSDGAWSIAADGPLAYELAGADRPLSLLDITQDLGEEDTVPLAELQPDLILPVVWDQTLQAVAFLKRAADQEREYEVSEHFALELVMRLLADHGGRGRSARVDGPTSEVADADEVAETDETVAAGDGADGSVAADESAGDAQVLREPAVLPTLFALARDLPVARELERFWKLFVERASGLFFVKSLVYLAPECPEVPAVCLGRARSGVAQLDLSGERLAKYFANLQRPVQVKHMPASFATVRDDLLRLGVSWIARLGDARCPLGILLLGLEPRIDRDDQTDLIAETLAVTVQALALLRDRERNADLRYDLLRTVIGLYEHHDRGAVTRTGLVERLLPLLARKLNFPAEQRRELMCGVLLSDIGRVEHAGVVAAADVDDDEGRSPDREHPATGAELLEPLQVSPTVTEVVLYHHERFDGTGFPHGRQGREIPLAARIAAVVVTYANLVTGDGDTAGMDPEDAAQALRGYDPGRLDPKIVDALVAIVDETTVPVGAA